MPANALAWNSFAKVTAAVSGTAFWYPERRPLEGGLLGGVAYGAITGLVLVWLLRGKSSTLATR